MSTFINDELINIIYFIINYCNNDYIRNWWFICVDYYNINNNANAFYIIYMLFFGILIVSLILLYLISKLYNILGFIYLYFQSLLRL